MIYLFSEIDLDFELANSTSGSSTSGFTTYLPTSASVGSTTAKTVDLDPRLSSGSREKDNHGFDIVHGSSISTLEGSGSLENDDTITMDSELKQLYPTTPEGNLVSEEDLDTSESLEETNTSLLPTDFPTAQYKTSGYREYLDTSTTAFEEASGEETGITIAALGEDTTVVKEDDEVSQAVANITVVPTSLLEESNHEDFSSSPQEEAKVSLSLEKEVEVAATVVPEEQPQTVEDGASIVTPPLNEANVDPTHSPIGEAYVSLKYEEASNIVSTTEEEAKAAPTFKDEIRFTPTFEDEAHIAPTVEDQAGVPQTLENKLNVDPNLDEEVSIAPTPEEEANIVPIIEEESFAKNLEEEPVVIATLEEEASHGPTLALEEEVKGFPTIHETTTSQPQESLIDLWHSSKPPSLKTTAAPDSLTSARSTTATTKTATTSTTTHSSRRSWSPTTSTAPVPDKMTEPQKVTHLILPVDQGLVDVEFSLTQPPTLLILPNERAAVGGAGKASGNVKATVISLTVLLLLLGAMVH